MLFLVWFQLLTLRAGWSLSAVMSSLSPRIFPLPVCLIHCNLVSLSSEVSFPFFHVLFRCKVARLSLTVWVAHFAQSLTLSFSIFRSFGLLSLQHVGLCLFLRDRRSSCSCADWASLCQRKWKGSRYCLYVIVFNISSAWIGVRIVSVKRVSTCIYGMTYVRQIYIYIYIWKSIVQHTSVGSLRLAPMTHMHKQYVLLLW